LKFARYRVKLAATGKSPNTVSSRSMMTDTGTPPNDNVTQLLARWSNGDKAALDQLVPLVYAELRRLATSYLRRRGRAHTLEPTALVHEAYIQLADQSKASFQNRAQFFGLAAKVMRDILVDHARRKLADKRGGHHVRLSLSHADRLTSESEIDVIALDLALNQLAATSPEHSRIVELRFFGGLTIDETSEATGLSHATVERYWSFARAWLRRELGD
jgi:RNA polymerase sigma factor (TIGR02999 family)